MSVKNNTLDTRYQSLLQDILDNGVEKKDRTGTASQQEQLVFFYLTMGKN